jgi:hypothetical protein
VRRVAVASFALGVGLGSASVSTGRVLAGTRNAVAWAALGHATTAREIAVAYCRRRWQFGKPLVSFQIVQDRLVKVLAEVCSMQLYCLRLGRLIEEGRLGAGIGAAARTSRREPTSTDGPPSSSIASPRSSTTGRAYTSGTAHHSKPCNDGHASAHHDDSQRSLETVPPRRWSRCTPASRAGAGIGVAATG